MIFTAYLCLTAAGCQLPVSESESQYDRISREIEQIKASADIGDNIKVAVHFLSVNLEDRFAVDALWRYADNSIVVANRPEVYARSGLRIGVAGDRFRARVDLIKEQLPYLSPFHITTCRMK